MAWRETDSIHPMMGVIVSNEGRSNSYYMALRRGDYLGSKDDRTHFNNSDLRLSYIRGVISHQVLVVDDACG